MKRLAIALLLGAVACGRSKAPPPVLTDTTATAASPAATTPRVATPLAVAAVCDSVAAALGRRYHDPTLTRGLGFLDLGDGLDHPACRVEMSAHTGVHGAPPLPLTVGPTPDGWEKDSRFMADGVNVEQYGFRGHGAVCSVEATWDDPGDLPDSELAHYQWSDELRLDVNCATDPASVPTPAGGPALIAGSDDERNNADFVPWKGAERLNIENLYTCYWYDSLTVVVVPQSAEAGGGVPGADIYVRKGRHKPCGRDSLPDDFILRAGFFNRFRGIIDNTLFVEDGDASSYSGLQLYDLRTHRKVADLSVAGIDGGVGAGALGVWMSDTVSPTTASCPPGDGIRVQRLSIVTLATGALTPTAKLRCRYEE